MKGYKTLVLSGRRILKAVGLVALSSVVTAAAFTITEKRFTGDGVAEKILNENLPVTEWKLYEKNLPEKGESLAGMLLRYGLGFVPDDTTSVLEGTLPVYTKREPIPQWEDYEPFEDKYDGEHKMDEAIPIPAENQAPIKNIDAGQRIPEGGIVAIGNETSYGININEMAERKPEIDMSVQGPKVLITHTHATESYAEEGATVYDVTKGDRSDDISKNVVAVGDRLYEILNSYGIDTLHDKILHDKPSFNGSYAHSLDTVNRYMEKYPTIQMVLDIHRDSIVYDDKTKAKTVTDIDGRPAAQLMLVVGTDEKGLEHPEWRENLTAAIHIQKCVTEKYPSLMRHINLRKERFNGHTSYASFIVEVGTSGNSLSEAVYGIELFGKCVADYLMGM